MTRSASRIKRKAFLVRMSQCDEQEKEKKRKLKVSKVAIDTANGVLPKNHPLTFEVKPTRYLEGIKFGSIYTYQNSISEHLINKGH